MRLLDSCSPPVCAALLAPLLVLATSCAESPRVGPRIEITKAEVDFGSVTQCDAVQSQFEIHNRGGMPLLLELGQTGCDLTAQAAARITAGASSAVAVKLDTCGLAGPVQRSLVLSTNDPTQPAITLTLRGHISADIAVTPAAIYVGHLQRGQDASLDAKLTLRAGLTVEAQGGRVIEAEVRVPRRGQSEPRLHLRIRRDATAGRFDDVVRLSPKGSRGRAVEVNVSGFVDAG